MMIYSPKPVRSPEAKQALRAEAILANAHLYLPQEVEEARTLVSAHKSAYEKPTVTEFSAEEGETRWIANGGEEAQGNVT